MSASGRVAIGIWIAWVLACAFLLSRTTITTDLSAFLPRTPTPAQQILIDQLRDGVVSRLILVAAEGAPPESLAALSQSFANRLRKENAFVSINNGDEEGLRGSREFLWRNRYVLSVQVTPDHFSPTELKRALENDLQLLGSAAGTLIKQVLPNDPTGELVYLLDQIAGEQPPVTRDGVWFSPDERRALLLIQTRAAGFDIDAQQQALDLIATHFQAAKDELKLSSDVRLLQTGPGVFAVGVRSVIKEDALRLSLIATALIASLLLLVYRSPLVVLMGLLPVATGALTGIAAVSFVFGSVHGITLGFGVTLIGEAVDYAVYLFTQTAAGGSPRSTLARIWPTLRLGMLTSVCGFSAMLFSGFSGLAELGLLSIAGLIAALSVTRFVLPVLLPADFYVPDPFFGRLLLGPIHFAPRLRIPFVGVALLAVVFLAMQPGSLWDDDLQNLSPISVAERQLDQQLRQDTGAPDVRFVIVAPAPSQDEALAKSEALAATLETWVDDGKIAGFDYPAFYLPSRPSQEARRAALPLPDTLAENLKQASAGLPFNPGVFQPFLRDVAEARERPRLDRASIGENDLALKLDSMLIPRGQSWVAMLPLRGVRDGAALGGEFARAEQGGAVLLDLREDFGRLYQSYRRDALALSIAGAGAIMLLLALFLRSPRRVYHVLAPLAAAVGITMALLIASGQKLSIFHLVGLLLTVAVGSNYSLFFETQYRRGDSARDRTVSSLALANVSTVIGFGILAFSRVPVLHGIGLTVAIGTVLSLLFSAVLIRGGDDSHSHPAVATT